MSRLTHVTGRIAVAMTLIGASAAAAQTQAGAPAPTQQSVYSLYVARHDATVHFAELGAKSENKDVRKLAELLQKEHRETAEKIRKLAAKDNVTLASPPKDTVDALFAIANQSLPGKSGVELDSAFAVQAYQLLMAMVLENNLTVTHRLPDGDLKKFGQGYTTFVFRQVAEAGKVRDKWVKTKK